MNEDDNFSLPQLNHDLEQFWIDLKEQEHKSKEFARSLTTLSSLNTVCIVVLCIAFIVLVATLRTKGMLGDDRTP